MTKEQVERHGAVIKWFCDNPDKGVFELTSIGWEITYSPEFYPADKYVQNDEFAEFRKALIDCKTIQLLMYNQDFKNGENWIDTAYIDTQKEPHRYRIKPEIEFPIYAKATNSNLYVEFTDEKIGKVIYANDRVHASGQVVKNWVSVFDKDDWIIIDNPYKLTDKCLVECLDDNMLYAQLRFYDARNNCVFSINGYRAGTIFENYKRIPPWQESEWVTEARKKLED